MYGKLSIVIGNNFFKLLKITFNKISQDFNYPCYCVKTEPRD